MKSWIFIEGLKNNFWTGSQFPSNATSHACMDAWLISPDIRFCTPLRTNSLVPPNNCKIIHKTHAHSITFQKSDLYLHDPAGNVTISQRHKHSEWKYCHRDSPASPPPPPTYTHTHRLPCCEAFAYLWLVFLTEKWDWQLSVVGRCLSSSIIRAMISILLPAGSELPFFPAELRREGWGRNVYELYSFLTSQWQEQRVTMAHLPPSPSSWAKRRK